MQTEDIRIESLNLPALDLNLASCIPEVRAYSVGVFQENLRLSMELGGNGVVVVPGRVSSLLPPQFSDVINWLVDSMERVLKSADETAQTIFMESHPLTPIPTIDLIEEFLQRVNHPRLMVAYDVANAEFIGEEQRSALRRLAPKLGQVHLSDSTRQSWRHDRAGLGTVDFAKVMATLKEIGFDGVSIIEIISQDAIHDIEAMFDLVSELAGISST